jgi:MADS-box transcription factor
MADITDQHDQTSPNDLAESHSVGNGNGGAQESRGIKRARPAPGDDDDDDDEKGGRERRKIEIKFISDKSRRHITFSKRKAGIMKKVSYVDETALGVFPARICVVPRGFTGKQNPAWTGTRRVTSATQYEHYS